MHAPTPPVTTKELVEAPKRPVEHRCRQCGELLANDRALARPAGARDLCIDCAFDTIPCTD